MTAFLSKITSLLKKVWRLNLNIKQKLLLFNVVAITIPIIILQLNYFNKLRLITEKEYINNSRLELIKLKSDITKNVEQCIRATLFVSNNQDFIDFVTSLQEKTPEEVLTFKTNVLDQIERIQYINSNINRIRFFTVNSYVPEMWPVIYQFQRLDNQREIKKFINNSNQDVFWKIENIDFLGPPLNKEEKVVSCYTKVTDSLGDMVGIIEVNMLTDEFFAHGFSQSSEKEILIALTDKNEIIADGQISKFLNEFGLNTKKLKEILRAKIKKKDGVFTIKEKEHYAAIIYTYLPILNTFLCEVVLFDNVNRQINILTKQMFVQVIILILMFSILISFIITVIFEKLKKIIFNMRKVEEGNFDINIDILGNDEIDEVAYHFKKMVEKIKILIADTVKRELAQKDAQIKALQSQINAHFIYNVLENIKMMAECAANYEVSDAITKLGKMMRYNMSWKKENVTLKEELEDIQNYVSLMNLRFDNEIKLLVNIDEKLLNFEVPKLILQPIVENAIIHGIKPKCTGGNIFIDIYVINSLLIISVIDDGKGIERERLEKIQNAIEEKGDINCCQGHGVALKNVSDRIKLTYGKEYGVRIESNKGEFTKVTITLPYYKSCTDAMKIG